jgi:hypothetical protein
MTFVSWSAVRPATSLTSSEDVADVWAAPLDARSRGSRRTTRRATTHLPTRFAI